MADRDSDYTRSRRQASDKRQFDFNAMLALVGQGVQLQSRDRLGEFARQLRIGMHYPARNGPGLVGGDGGYELLVPGFGVQPGGRIGPVQHGERDDARTR